MPNLYDPQLINLARQCVRITPNNDKWSVVYDGDGILDTSYCRNKKEAVHKATMLQMKLINFARKYQRENNGIDRSFDDRYPERHR